MKKQITVKEYKGKFLLIGADGYSTTARKWNTRGKAEKAAAREQKLAAAGQPSYMRWEY
jgi:hypothetical protein